MTKRLQPMIDDPSEPAYVRDLLHAGREDQVADYDFDKGLTKHLAQIQAGAPAPQWAESLKVTSAGAVASAASGSTLIPWIALPIVTAAVITAVMVSTSPEPGEPRPVVAAPLAAPVPATALPPVQAPQEPAVTQPAAQPVPEPAVPSARPERRAPVGSQMHRPRTPRASKQAPAFASAKAERTHESAAPLAPSTAATPSAASGRASTTERSASGSAPVPAPPTIAIEDPPPAASAEPVDAPTRPERPPQDDARLEREMAMLAMSQRVLHVDPERALKLARQGEAEFTGSMFTQERQQVLLLSLVKLGRLDEAKRLAKPYLARYPKGPFSDRVRRALAAGRVEH
jgi:hypothetical protein